MAKIKYSYIENKKLNTHSFYARPIYAGTLDFEELCEEACEDNTYDIDEMRGCVGRFMKAVERETLRGFRCKLGKDFLTVYPNLKLSVKDYTDKETGQLVVATPDMLNAQNGISKLGCSVSSKFSTKFAQEVSWTKVDKSGAVAEEEDDITEGNENVEGGQGNQGGTTPTTNGENSEP